MNDPTRRRRFKLAPSLRVILLRHLFTGGLRKYKRQFRRRIRQSEFGPLVNPVHQAIKAIEESDFERDEVFGTVEFPTEIINDYKPPSLMEKLKAFIARIIAVVARNRRNRSEYCDLP